jgi:hypothetical protein
MSTPYDPIAENTLSLLGKVRPQLSDKLRNRDGFTKNPTRMCRVRRICQEGYGHLLPYSYCDFDKELDKAERQAGIVRQTTKLVRQNAHGGNSEEELAAKLAEVLREIKWIEEQMMTEKEPVNLPRLNCVDQNS